MTDLPSPSVEGGEPTTETGRALLTLAENHNLDCADPAACCFPAYIADGERILAIEAEASAQPAPPLDVERHRIAFARHLLFKHSGGDSLIPDPCEAACSNDIAERYARLGSAPSRSEPE